MTMRRVRTPSLPTHLPPILPFPSFYYFVLLFCLSIFPLFPSHHLRMPHPSVPLPPPPYAPPLCSPPTTSVCPTPLFPSHHLRMPHPSVPLTPPLYAPPTISVCWLWRVLLDQITVVLWCLSSPPPYSNTPLQETRKNWTSLRKSSTLMMSVRGCGVRVGVECAGGVCVRAAH